MYQYLTSSIDQSSGESTYWGMYSKYLKVVYLPTFLYLMELALPCLGQPNDKVNGQVKHNRQGTRTRTCNESL